MSQALKETTWTLRRSIFAGLFTLGMLFGVSQYVTVEDTVRQLSSCTVSTCVGKIAGQTAIPAGTYEVRDTYSPRFKRNMLELIDVPGFQGIRIHSGNSAQDTEGCILLGNRSTPTGVSESRAAMERFNREAREVLKTGRLYIKIEDAPNGMNK